MPDLTSAVEIVAGSLCIGTLLLVSFLRQRKMPQLTDAVSIFIAALGVVGGFRLCIISMEPKLFELVRGDRSYVFLAGISVVWVSAEMIWRLITKYGRDLTTKENRS